MKSIQSLALSLVIVLLGTTAWVSPTLKASKYKIDTQQSTVKWNGKKVTGEHYGSIKVNEGSFDYDGKLITGGKVVIDMNSLTVEDIKDKKGQDRLAGHLKNDDFFATDKFPTATLVVKNSSKGENGQLIVNGDLTIKEITKPVSFPVTVKSAGKNTVETTGTITVDRSKYDIKFRSKSFMDVNALGDKMIYDDFTLDVKVIAKK